jgi:glycosyltransferase involved in cell wall biosynthesis
MQFKHITVVHPSMHFIGGAERLMKDLAVGLADEETTVELVTGVCHNLWRNELHRKKNQVLLKELGQVAPGNLLFWLNVKGFVKALAGVINPETDLIITSTFPSSLVADLFAKHHHVKKTHYFHEAPMVLHDEEGLKALPSRLRLFYRFVSMLYAKADIAAIRKSDMILANSQLTRRVNAKIYGIDESRVELVYPGVNIETITPSMRMPQLISRFVKNGTPIIFIPRGAQFWRRPEVCLQAFKSLRIRHFVAIFTGGAHYEAAALIKHARTLGIADKVLWIRELSNEELNALYSHSSLVVSIPKCQPFGLIPLEALVCGAPPIISSSSGASEVLRDGMDTICVSDGDSEELTASIEALLLDAELGRKLVSNGQRRVLAEFTSAQFVKRVKENISKLAA